MPYFRTEIMETMIMSARGKTEIGRVSNGFGSKKLPALASSCPQLPVVARQIGAKWVEAGVTLKTYAIHNTRPGEARWKRGEQ
jgi:hypothetical protein